MAILEDKHSRWDSPLVVVASILPRIGKQLAMMMPTRHPSLSIMSAKCPKAASIQDRISISVKLGVQLQDGQAK